MTSRELTDDALNCVPTHTKAQMAIGLFTLGLTTPIQGVAGAAANQSPDKMDGCMKEKGYTVNAIP